MTTATDFQLIDLISQRWTVRQALEGWSAQEILAWLANRGKLTRVTITVTRPDVFYFESVIGLQASFFFDGDEMIFLGDHFTFR